MQVQIYRIDQDGFFIEPVLFDVERVRRHEAGLLSLGEDIVTVPIPEGLYRPRWNGETWEEGRSAEGILSEAKSVKIEEIKQKANEAILSGFKSSALGAEHSYSFDYEAQINLVGIKSLLSDADFTGMSWSTRGTGDVFHDREQLQKLWHDGMKHKMDNQQRYWELKRKIDAATTREEVAAIIW